MSLLLSSGLFKTGATIRASAAHRWPFANSSGGFSPQPNTVEANPSISGTFREKFWVIQHGSSDYEGWVADDTTTDSTLYRFTSTDAVSWTADAGNPVLADTGKSHQDPSVVIDTAGDFGTAGTYYLFVEDENATDVVAIEIYTSTDGQSWTHQSTWNGSPGGEPGSPAAVIDSGTIYVFYEPFGMGTPYDVRYATSTDGTTLTDQGIVYSEDTANGPIPDDIFRDPNGTWTLYYHLGGTTGRDTPKYATADTLLGTYTTGSELTAGGIEFTSPTTVHAPQGSYGGTINNKHYVYGWDANSDIDLFSSGGAATTVYDSIGTVDGTVNNTTWSSGTWIDNYALQFDKASSYVVYDNTVPEIDANSAFAITGTIEATSNVTDAQTILHHQTSDSNRVAGLINNGELAFSVYDGADVGSASGSISANTRYRYVYNFDGGTNGTLYLNTTEQTGTTLSSTTTGVTGFELGRRLDNNLYFGGYMDEPMVDGSQLSTTEIQDDYDRQPWTP